MEVPQCPGCLERDNEIAALKAEVVALTKKVDELLRRLPPLAPRPEGRYPAAPAKKATGKKAGGQPDHPPHLKKLAPPERVDETIFFAPSECQYCQAKLPAEAGPNDPLPTRHQVAELPAMVAIITEYQGHSRTCPCCHKVTHATIPKELRATSVGPRYSATLSYLAGMHGVSKRGMEEITEAIFDAPLSLGTVSNLEREMSAALEQPHQQAIEAVRKDDVKHLDETGWKENGRKRWLWAAATQQVVAFMIHRFRNPAALLRMLGPRLEGIICTDRWHAYTIYPLGQRQICWAHLKRNLQKLTECGGYAKRIGTVALDVQRRVFEQWHLFRGGGCTRQQLQTKLDKLREEFIDILCRGMRGPNAKTARFCVNLCNVEEALWTFGRVEGVEPTNNHVERVQRRAVLWRRRSFGCHSEEGCRFVERILTVTETLRLQKRSVIEYLTVALQAHRDNQPTPALA